VGTFLNVILLFILSELRSSLVNKGDIKIAPRLLKLIKPPSNRESRFGDNNNPLLGSTFSSGLESFQGFICEAFRIENNRHPVTEHHYFCL
jgi:hypothetical protein